MCASQAGFVTAGLQEHRISKDNLVEVRGWCRGRHLSDLHHRASRQVDLESNIGSKVAKERTAFFGLLEGQ